MAHHVDRVVAVAVALVVLAQHTAALGYEARKDRQVGATTDSNGTTVVGHRLTAEPGTPVASRPRTACTYERADGLPLAVPFVDEVDLVPVYLADQPPGTVVLWKRCPGQPARLLVVPPADRAAAGRVLAEELVAQVPLPDSRIRTNPSSRGLVGIESWFWVEGYDGSPIARSIDVFGLAVDVEMTLERVRWAFGDGTEQVGDLGRAYPAESSVRHAYQRDSGDTAYEVVATFVFGARFRVAGGPWVSLPPIARQAGTSHRVIQAEAVRTR